MQYMIAAFQLTEEAVHQQHQQQQIDAQPALAQAGHLKWLRKLGKQAGKRLGEPGSKRSAVRPDEDCDFQTLLCHICFCEECISGSMRYITSSYMATAFGSRPPWSSLHGLGEDSTASLNIRVLRPKIE